MIDRRRISAARRLGSLALATLFLLPWAGSHLLEAWWSGTPGTVSAQTEQIPEHDRLAEPILPESPTQVDIGRRLYYFHCMPCHGDRGQGLTDEWREVWVEDHQNCWGRGCHTGKSEMSAFYVPHSIPAVIGSPRALAAFRTAEELFIFLRATQPPQRPGALADSAYWALTSFLLHENGRPLPDGASSPAASGPSVSSSGVFIATLIPLLALFSVTWLVRRPAKPVS
jgi:hypothetical protein